MLLNKQAFGCLSCQHNTEIQYLGAGTGANSRRGTTHILNLHPAGQNPETLGNLLVADPPGGVLTGGGTVNTQQT